MPDFYMTDPLLTNTTERAIKLAESSALENSVDMPIAAVALRGAIVAGEGTALDQKNKKPHMHAEVVALSRAKQNHIHPTMLVSTVEPCVNCVQAIAAVESIDTVAYLIGRDILESMGLVNPAKPIEPHDYPFEVVRLDNPSQLIRALEPYNFVKRTPTNNKTEAITSVDSGGFRAHLAQRPTMR